MTDARTPDPAIRAALVPLYARRRELEARRKEIRAELRAARVRHRPDATALEHGPPGSPHRAAFDAAIVGDAGRLGEAIAPHEARLAEIDRDLAQVEAAIAELRIPARRRRS